MKNKLLHVFRLLSFVVFSTPCFALDCSSIDLTGQWKEQSQAIQNRQSSAPVTVTTTHVYMEQGKLYSEDTETSVGCFGSSKTVTRYAIDFDRTQCIIKQTTLLKYSEDQTGHRQSKSFDPATDAFKVLSTSTGKIEMALCADVNCDTIKYKSATTYLVF